MRIELMHTGEHSRSATIHFAELRDVVEHDLVEALATMRSDMPGASSLAPFPTEREQMADLYKWLSGQYTVSRPLDPDDFEEV